MRKLILSLALAAPLAALANGYDVPNLTTRDLAMGGAAVAAQVDAGAVYGMPAALARLPEGLSFNVSDALVDIRTTWNATTAALAPRSPDSTRFHPAFPPSLFASYTTRILDDRGFGVGVGMNVVAGSNQFWHDGWAGRSRIISVDRRVYGLYAVAAIEVVKQLRVGGGLTYYRTTEELVQGVDPTTGTATLTTSGGVPAFHVAAEGEPIAGVPLTLAIDYEHQGVQNLTGRVHFDVPATLQAQLQDQNVTHQLTYPNKVNVGASYRLLPNLVLGATFTFHRYVVYNEDLFVGDKLLPGPIVVPRNYGNGQVYRLGVEWLATPQLALRAGGFRDVSGMPKQSGPNGELLSNTYSPTLPDSNSWTGALGVGWKFAKNLEANGAFFYAKMDEVTSTGPVAFPGRYDTHVFVYSLGLTYHWAPGEGIAQLQPVNAE